MNDEKIHVRLTSAHEVASSVPALVGFQPADGDLVTIVLTGKRVGLTTRLSLDQTSLSHMQGGVRALVEAIRRGQPDADSVLLITYTRYVINPHLLGAMFEDLGLRVQSSLRVHEGRVYEDALDREGVPLAEVSAVQVADAVENGRCVAESRDALAERFAFVGYGPGPLASEQEWETVTTWRDRVHGVDTRDRTMGWLAGLDHADLRTALDGLVVTLRYTPHHGPKRGDMLAVAAFAAYLLGDGGFANVLLEHAPADHRLARLLSVALEHAVPPSELRKIGLAMAED